MKLPSALWLIWNLSFKGFGPTSAALFVAEKFTMIGTPGWINGNCSITNDTGEQTFSVYMNVQKRLNHKIMLTFKILKVENGMKKKVLSIPKFNYCDLRRTSGNIPILSEFFTSLKSFGTLIFDCPVLPDVYYVKNVPLSTLVFAQFVMEGFYHLILELFDDNDRKKSQLIVRFIAENYRI